MDILLKGHAKMIIWINLRVRIRVKRTVHRFITDTNVIVTLAGYKFHHSPLKPLKLSI
jgi:hypothetical protein